MVSSNVPMRTDRQIRSTGNSMENQEQAFKRLHPIFEDGGDGIRKQFILAGLLLTIFECFKTYVVAQVDGFFSNHMEVVDGQIKVTRGEEFKKLIKERGKGQPGEHGNKVFRAAIKWFGELNAVEDWELKEVERLYNLRNDVGHELFRILADDKKNPISVVDVMLIFSVYVKIVRWWVREVEISTDPDMTPEKYDSIDFDGIESIETTILREIMHKSLEGMPEWHEWQDWVKKHSAEEADATGAERYPAAELDKTL
jgi:hypothetical protein